MEDFESALTKLINSCCMETGSDTPDFILAAYMKQCLDAFNSATRERDHWKEKK